MNKKEYLKPEMTLVKVELESLILGNSIDGEGGEGSKPGEGDDSPAASKEDNNSSNIWGNDEW